MNCLKYQEVEVCSKLRQENERKATHALQLTANNKGYENTNILAETNSVTNSVTNSSKMFLKTKSNSFVDARLGERHHWRSNMHSENDIYGRTRPTTASLVQMKSSFAIDDLAGKEKTDATLDDSQQTLIDSPRSSQIELYRIRKLEEKLATMNQRDKRRQRSSKLLNVIRLKASNLDNSVRIFSTAETNSLGQATTLPPKKFDMEFPRRQQQPSLINRSLSNMSANDQIAEIDKVRMQITKEINQIMTLPAPQLARIKSVVFRNEVVEYNKPISSTNVAKHAPIKFPDRPKSNTTTTSTSRKSIIFGSSNSASNTRA